MKKDGLADLSVSSLPSGSMQWYGSGLIFTGSGSRSVDPVLKILIRIKILISVIKCLNQVKKIAQSFCLLDNKN